MKKRVFSIMGLGFLLAAFALAVVPAQAQNVDEKIKVLEQELSTLKSEQMELKKDAVAAAAALPSFTYRRGFLGITAADKSWQISFSHELHYHIYNHLDGADHSGATTGDIFSRRNRPFIFYCWQDCLYEIGFGIDMDDGDNTSVQTNKFTFHFENLNPYFPSLEISDKGNQAVSYVSRSSSSSARVELTRDIASNSGIDTLSHAAIGIGWLDVPVGPGDYTLWTEYRIGPGFNINDNSDSDKKQFFLKAGTRPFSKTKNKWLRGLKFGGGWTVGSVERFEADDERDNTSSRLRLRTTDRVGRFTVFDTGVLSFCDQAVAGDCTVRGQTGRIGKGTMNDVQFGLEWRVGPYLFRNENSRSSFEGIDDAFRGVRASAWSIQHELFLWSAKGGFLTGSSSTPHSLQVGWSFARGDMDCGKGADCLPGTGAARKNHLTQREWDVWYYVRNGLSVGAWWSWWHTPNTPRDLQEDIGCKTTSVRGKACNWHTVNLGLRANF